MINFLINLLYMYIKEIINKKETILFIKNIKFSRRYMTFHRNSVSCLTWPAQVLLTVDLHVVISVSSR